MTNKRGKVNMAVWLWEEKRSGWLRTRLFFDLPLLSLRKSK
jgi:hypothetical protein